MPDPTAPNLARDKLTYWPANGTPIEFVPEDGSVLVADRAVERIDVIRPAGADGKPRVGRWVPAGSTGVPPVPPAAPSTPPVATVPPVIVAPAVAPPVAVVPPLVVPPITPSIVRRVADATEPRNYGLQLNVGMVARGDTTPRTIRGAIFDGFGHNIAFDRVGGDVLIENVRSVNAYPVNEADLFDGQGSYVDGVDSLTIRGLFSSLNGWQPGRDPKQRNGFRHGGYYNFGVKRTLVEDSWFDRNSCAGAQARGPSIFRRCLFTDNAVALLLIMGGSLLEDCTVYGGHHRYDPAEPGDKASWTGNVAVSTYWPVTLKNFWAVGAVGQDAPCNLIPGLKSNNLGAFVGSGTYGKAEWKPPTDDAGNVIRRLFAATDCRNVAWPGPAFAGDRPHDGTGFIVAGSPVDVRAELDALRAEAMASTTGEQMAAIVARGQKLIRDAATRTFAR